jgi:TRAP-type mannitol/chloroaromatic compound transport system substrate-binding protein
VPPNLVCSICGVRVGLSDDRVLGMAEIATFYAAHGSHDEGMSVAATFEQPDDEEAS